MSFEGLFRDGALFGGLGEGDSRPGSNVASMYGCKPRGLERKSCFIVEVVDQGSNDGKGMGIQGEGSGAPLRQDRCGASEFLPAAKDDHAVLGEHSDCGFFR